MSKRDAEIYREAAKLIEVDAEQYCCRAIQTVITGAMQPFGTFDEIRDLPPYLYNPFAALFKPVRITKHGWFGDPWVDMQHQNRRVLALCFMAAIAEDE